MEEKFKYYNHSLIPNCLNCEEIEFTKNELKEAFKKHKKALFFLYTTKFDCGYDTGWYYVIKDDECDYSCNHSKKHIREIVKMNQSIECSKISFRDYENEIDEIGNSCLEKYNIRKKHINYRYSEKQIIIGAFFKENKKLIGYETIEIHENEIMLVSEKVLPNYKKFQVPYALNKFIIDKYLRQLIDINGYISNGSKNIIHDTGHHEWLVRNFGFRYAYCYLHLIIKPSFKLLFYPLLMISPFLKLFNSARIIRSINSLMKLYRIAKRQKKHFLDYV